MHIFCVTAMTSIQELRLGVRSKMKFYPDSNGDVYFLCFLLLLCLSRPLHIIKHRYDLHMLKVQTWCLHSTVLFSSAYICTTYYICSRSLATYTQCVYVQRLISILTTVFKRFMSTTFFFC